jgi:acetyl-CoA acetyltransferase
MDPGPRIGIIGIGEPGYEPRINATLPELAHRVAAAAVDDTDVDLVEVDNVVACASDLEDGRAISSMTTAAPAGSYGKDFIKTTNTGIHAVDLAMMRMEAGMFDTTLVISWGKGSEADLEATVPLEGDPFYRRSTGLGHLSGHATQAAAYREQRTGAGDAAATVVEACTRAGNDNPWVHSCDPVSAGDVPESDVVSWPLRKAHLPPESDGGTALVLATEHFIREYVSGTEPVWIDGIGRQTATYNIGDREPGRLDALNTAAKRAYNDAGIVDPSAAHNAVELHGKSAYHELMALEATSLAVDAPAAVLEDRFEGASAVDLNRSGGTLAANPLIGAGLARVAAAARQVRGDWPGIDPVDSALAHSTAGFTDQAHGVTILRGETGA